MSHSLECFEEGTEIERHDARSPILRYQDSNLTDEELIKVINDPMTGEEDREIHKEILAKRQGHKRS